MFWFVLVHTVVGINSYVLNYIQTAENTGDRLTSQPDIELQPDLPANDFETLSVDKSLNFQGIQGFGGAFTDSTSWLFSQLPEDKQEEVLEAYFGEHGHKYTLCRLQIGSSDFALNHYNYDNVTDDYDLENFSISHDEEYIIPFIQKAMKKRAEVKDAGSIRFLSSPWSPPAWMKRNNRMQNSLMPCLRQEVPVFSAYAMYFSKYVSSYKNAGVDISYITVQNEPHVAKQFVVTYECCGFEPTHERDFLRDYLGPQMRLDHPDVKIYIHDDQKDDKMVDMVNTVMEDKEAAQFVDGVAFHWYDNWGKNYDILDEVQEAYPSLPLLATEATLMRPLTQDLPWNEGKWKQGQKYAIDIIRDLNHGATGWIDWNMLLDLQGGPSSQHLGRLQDLGNCDAPIRLNLTGYPWTDVESGDGSLIFGSAYWHYGHFTRYLPVGAVRVGLSSDYTPPMEEDESVPLEFVSFLVTENDTEQLITVVLNANDNAKSYNFNLPDYGSATLTIPAQGIQTLLLKL